MELKCSNCKKEWNYQGKNKVFVTCPDCRKIIKIKDNQNKKEVKST